MKILRFVFCQKLVLGASAALLSTISIQADETKERTESTSRSSSSQVEVRRENSADNKSVDTEKNQEQVTIAVGVAGDHSDIVKSAIEKLEKQLKASRLPVELQQKALESLRAQLEQNAGGKKGSAGTATWSYGQNASSPTAKAESPAKNDEEDSKKGDHPKEGSDRKMTSEQRYEIRLPFDRLNQNFTWRGPQKPPFRLGIGCRVKDANDTNPGLEVETVFEDSPASAAGLKPGDRLIKIDDQAIETLDHIIAAVQKAGEENRSIRLEATRGEVSTIFEIKPNQTAVADLTVEMLQPGSMSMPFSGQAWVMPQWPAGGTMNFGNLVFPREINLRKISINCEKSCQIFTENSPRSRTSSKNRAKGRNRDIAL